MRNPDFIEVYEDALSGEDCRRLLDQFERSGQAVPGEVGSGVFPELKDSRDIHISGRPEWADAEGLLNQAVFRGLMQYLRKYRYALIAPLMMEVYDPATGKPARLTAELFERMSDEELAPVVQHIFRPGGINLQRYTRGQGGYPYWHCELYPRDPNCEPLHRHLLWTIYLNNGFGEGETEFLYQQRKVVPKAGSLLIAPTAFTHTHRGNTPREGDKYIATSWILFQRAERLFGA